MRRLLLIVILFLVLRENGHANAGKTATKSGLVTAAKNTRQNQSSKSGSGTASGSRTTGSYSRRNKTNTPIQQLKEDIMDGYDATMAPVTSHKQNVNIQVGLTYRQVLDLDEKNQVLKSLIWLRVVWNDINISWDPADYGGLEDIEVPHSLVWMPDIVIYEEIGVRSYAPRLAHVKVKHDGTVQYQEPTSIETSCSIDTAYFPFDVQVCRMSFVSWSQPVTHVDLSSDRESWKLSRDTKSYFINTGEWKLARINVRKVVRDYGALVNRAAKTLDDLNSTLQGNLTDASTGNSTNSTEETTATVQVGPMKVENVMDSPTQHIETMLPGNHTITDSMYAEVIFTLVVRRNSSLYMQSMLFPSIILTTVALLGFYLPPESGERIGLQITILLTFMVFLLAVGEMFPASTGPYLGVYFVICMGLLGVNLGMTVMVLHIHFKPVVNKPESQQQKTPRRKTRMKRCAVSCCDSDSSGDEENCVKPKRKKRNGSAIPHHYRRFLQFCDRYWTLGERGSRWMRPVTDDEGDDVMDDDVNSGYESNSNECTWSDSRELAAAAEITVDLPVKKNGTGSCSAIPDVKFITETGRKLIEEKQKSVSEVNLASSKHNCGDLGVQNRNSIKRGKSTGYMEALNCDERNRSSGSTLRLAVEQKPNQLKYESKSDAERSNVLRHRVLNSITNMKGFTKVSKTDTDKRKRRNPRKKKKDLKKRRQQEKEDEQERQDLEQEEWKSVARAVDIIFFRVYVIFIIASHVGLLGAVFASWNSEDRN